MVAHLARYPIPGERAGGWRVPHRGGRSRLRSAGDVPGGRGAVAAGVQLGLVWYELADGVASEEPDDQVQVVFTPHPNGTLLQLTHAGPWTDDEAAENYRQGWTFVLDALAGTGASG